MGSDIERTNIPLILISVIAAVLLLAAMLTFWSNPLMAADWKTDLFPAARLAAQGGIPYETLDVYHPQPLFALLIPFAAVGEFAGYLALALLTIGAVAWTYRAFTSEASAWPLLFTFFSYPFLFVMWWGQLSGLELLAIVVAFEAWRLRRPWFLGAAYTLMALLLPNLLLIAAYWLWETIRRWRWRHVAVSILLPLLVLFTSLLPYGYWPADWYLSIVHKTGLSNFTSLWTLPIPPWLKLLLAIVPILLVAILWPGKPSPKAIAFLLATSYLISPYVTTYRLLPLYAVALPILVRNLWTGLFYWLISFLPLLGPFVQWPPYIDLAHVVILLAVYLPLALITQQTSATTPRLESA